MRSAVLLATVTGRADEDLALAPRTQKQSGIVHRSSRRGGLDDPTSPGNTGLGAVCKCGSGRSLGRDRQVNSVRGCVGLFADSDLTPTLPRRHRGYATRRHCAIGNIGAGGKQQQDSGGVAATTQSMFALFQQTQLMRAVRQIPALLRSHQHHVTDAMVSIEKSASATPQKEVRDFDFLMDDCSRQPRKRGGRGLRRLRDCLIPKIHTIY